MGEGWVGTSPTGWQWQTQQAPTPFGINAVDFGFVPDPTAVDLVRFDAVPVDDGVWIEWETSSETDNLGFNLYRSLSEEGSYEKVTARLIPGLGSSPRGASYSYRDTGLSNGETYFYKLEYIYLNAISTFHGPISAGPDLTAIPWSSWIYLPFVTVE